MSCYGLLERLGFTCREITETVISVGTPFSFADGEPIGFYLDEHSSEQVVISDNADTLAHLAGIGFDISDRKKWKGVKQIATAFGLELQDTGQIVGSEIKSKEQLLVTRFIGAMLAIADMERDYFGLSDEQEQYIQEVEMYLRASKPEATLLTHPTVEGHSGRIHGFHFDFDNKLVDAARPHGARTGAILRKSADVINSGSNKSILIIMDDRLDEERAKIETDILSTMVSVMPFTRLIEQASGNLIQH